MYISSIAFLQCILRVHCLSAVLAHSPAFFPSPFTTSTIIQRQNVTTCTVAERSHTQKSQQYRNPQSGRWGTKKNQCVCVCFLVPLNDQRISIPSSKSPGDKCVSRLGETGVKLCHNCVRSKDPNLLPLFMSYQWHVLGL